jgi:hypothetical protein
LAESVSDDVRRRDTGSTHVKELANNNFKIKKTGKNFIGLLLRAFGHKKRVFLMVPQKFYRVSKNLDLLPKMALVIRRI